MYREKRGKEKRENGMKIEKKRREIVKGKVEKLKKEGGKVIKWGEDLLCFCFSLLKTTKICFGSTKMRIFYREKTFQSGEKIRKNDFAPSEKYACYAPDFKCDLDSKIKIEYCQHVTHSPWSCHKWALMRDSLPVDLCINLKKLARESTWILAESLQECCNVYTIIFEPDLMVKCLVHVQKAQIAHSGLNSRPLLCEASSNPLNNTMFLMLKPKDVKFCFSFLSFF